MAENLNSGHQEEVKTGAMKTSFISSIRAWGTVALAAMCLFAFPVNSDARDHRHHGHHYSRSYGGHHHHHYPRYRGHRVVRSPYYYSYPRSSGFVITFGNGYAGRGYYYGPPRRSYYSRQPGVVYYSRRGLVPSRYW
ncbi:MAG: hypothetical protein V4672_19020 [Verrucomicrobiota bacterium]